MNIVLIGYRGTGKSSVGKFLAEKLDKKYVSTDNLIKEKKSMSIKEIVGKYGWKKFRQLENEAVRVLREADNCVIDTGGGIILNDENVKILKKNGILVLLKADSEVIAARIKDSKDMPSLTGKPIADEIDEVLEQRKEKYNKAADFTVNTANLSIEAVCNKIIEKLKNRI